MPLENIDKILNTKYTKNIIEGVLYLFIGLLFFVLGYASSSVGGSGSILQIISIPFFIIGGIYIIAKLIDKKQQNYSKLAEKNKLDESDLEKADREIDKCIYWDNNIIITKNYIIFKKIVSTKKILIKNTNLVSIKCDGRFDNLSLLGVSFWRNYRSSTL